MAAAALILSSLQCDYPQKDSINVLLRILSLDASPSNATRLTWSLITRHFTAYSRAKKNAGI